jgi:Tfp pilus assembly protein PilV
VAGEVQSGKRDRRGFVIGELLVAVLLLAVAVSSLAALMYSVSRRPEGREPVACVAKSGAAPGDCSPRSTAGGPSKLVRSGCATKSDTSARGCGDYLESADSSDEMIIRSRTDSASLAMLAKKEKAERTGQRSDRGFIR